MKVDLAVLVNKVLSFSGISISQDMLNKILSRPRLDFFDLDSNTLKPPVNSYKQ